jgi:MFS family permease
MQTVAQGWLVLELSHNSGVAVGLVVAIQFLPTLLLGFWGGVVADRFDKRRLLFVYATAQLVIAAALGAVVLAGAATLLLVYGFAALAGLAQAFDNPARQAFAAEMVPPEDLPNAIGLNSALFQASRVIGPAIAGVIIAISGTGWCFVLNALSFVALLVALARMRPTELYRTAPVASGKGQVREGLRYIWDTPLLRALLLLMVVVGTLAINFPVVLPLIAKITFHGGAGTYGLMVAAMGVGALFGALFVAHRSEATIRFLFGAGMLFGAGITAASFAPSLALFVALAAIVGLVQMAFIATANSMLQLNSDPQMRGRVMAVWSVAILGSTPIGGPLIGWISSVTSPRVGLAVGGIGTLAATAVFVGGLLRRRTVATLDAEPPALGSLPVDGLAPAAQTSRVVGTDSIPSAASSLTAATGSGSENSVPSL